MSIIGNAIAGGVGDGMRAYAGQMAQDQAADDRRKDLMLKLKADREEFLTKLASAQEEGRLNRTNALAVADSKNVSQFERRPDLYGANASPVDRAKFEKEESTFSRTDDSEYSDAVSRKNAPLVETKTKSFDEDGYKKAESERVDTNIRRKARVDSPQHADDLEKGVGRGIVNRELEKDPMSAAAAAAALTVEGKPRFSNSQGGNIVLDNATGSADTTDVGKSVVKKNERPPAGKGGGGSDANARALVASLRTQSSNISKNISKLSEGFVTPQKQAGINEAKKELAAINSRLRDAEAALSKSGSSQSDNRPASAAGKKDFSKLW